MYARLTSFFINIIRIYDATLPWPVVLKSSIDLIAFNIRKDTISNSPQGLFFPAQMIWKRLNDHGKNWRHVYKALVLMEYLIKTGSEKVAMQCKENIFAIHTLKDFQYMEEGKDQGTRSCLIVF